MDAERVKENGTEWIQEHKHGITRVVLIGCTVIGGVLGYKMGYHRAVRDVANEVNHDLDQLLADGVYVCLDKLGNINPDLKLSYKLLK